MKQNNKEKYNSLCKSEDLPIFFNDWWLDATCGETGWGVALYEENGLIVGALPYAIRRRWGFMVISQPKLTPFLGPWIRPIVSKTPKRLAREKDIMEGLIKNLPPHSYYSQQWSRQFSNWLPFFWAGFKQSTMYSYVLTDLSDLTVIQANFQDNAKSELKKARDRFKLSIRPTGDIKHLMELVDLSYKRQGKSTSFNLDLARRVHDACADRDCGAVLIMEDAQGRAHSGAFIVWDHHSAYYLLGGGDPDLRSSGAMTYCLWCSIALASTKTKSFDFEGSMIEPIERYFRSFGGEPQPYFHVTKVESKTLQMLLSIRSIIIAR